jgi:hypothetical protein
VPNPVEASIMMQPAGRKEVFENQRDWMRVAPPAGYSNMYVFSYMFAADFVRLRTLDRL